MTVPPAPSAPPPTHEAGVPAAAPSLDVSVVVPVYNGAARLGDRHLLGRPAVHPRIIGEYLARMHLRSFQP